MHAQEISQLKLDHIATVEQERQRHDADASVLRGQLEAMCGELQNTREALEQQLYLADPVSTFAHRFRSHEVGGVLTRKVNVLFENADSSTGNGTSFS